MHQEVSQSPYLSGVDMNYGLLLINIGYSFIFYYDQQMVAVDVRATNMQKALEIYDFGNMFYVLLLATLSFCYQIYFPNGPPNAIKHCKK